MSNQECKAKPAIVNINSNELSCYLNSVAANNAVVAAMVSITLIVNYAFLMLLNT